MGIGLIVFETFEIFTFETVVNLIFFCFIADGFCCTINLNRFRVPVFEGEGTIDFRMISGEIRFLHCFFKFHGVVIFVSQRVEVHIHQLHHEFASEIVSNIHRGLISDLIIP